MTTQVAPFNPGDKVHGVCGGPTHCVTAVRWTGYMWEIQIYGAATWYCADLFDFAQKCA